MSKPRERHPMPASPNSTKLETEMFQAKTINDSYGNYKYTQCLSADVVIQMTCQGYEPSIPQNDKYDVPLGIVDRLNAAIAKAGGTALRTPDRCQWQEDGEAWATQCGHLFQICHGSPEDNGMDFCPFCGRPITTEATP